MGSEVTDLIVTTILIDFPPLLIIIITVIIMIIWAHRCCAVHLDLIQSND